MRQRWAAYFPIWSFTLALSFGICWAEPTIDANVVLQVCRAFSKTEPRQMPKIVLPEAGKAFVEIYERYSKMLKGCLSATESKRDSDGITFLVQNTRYESEWRLSTENGSIKKISITKYRAVTLEDDADWQEPFSTWSPTTTLAAKDDIWPPPEPNIVDFFYATNRKQWDFEPSLEGNPPATSTTNGNRVFTSNGWTAVRDYSGERNSELAFGAVRVRVPEGHQIGKLELPSGIISLIFKDDNDPDPTKYFTIRSIVKTDEARWIQSLSSTKTKRALIFVHGFNTRFRAAVFRTAQIVWDLQFKGTAVLFSWPSRGEIADYFYDEKSALGSRDAFLRVVDNLRKAGFNRIDVIAHSMGNLVAVDALSISAVSRSPAAIAQLIMAAPDVDKDMFIQAIPKVAKVAKGLTLYASANDKALLLSKRVAGNIPRAGDVPRSGPIVMRSLSTIDVSVIGGELFGLNHSTFATTRNILNDLKILLENGTPAPRLAEIRGFPEPPKKATYFRYVP
jgi:esterase/lipase superfamily enzyme